MTKTSIEIEDDSVASAREQAKQHVPDGYFVVSERVISEGMPQTLEATADALEAAYVNLQSQMPAAAEILEKKERMSRVHCITVQAVSEQDAEIMARLRYEGGKIIGPIEPIAASKTGEGIEEFVFSLMDNIVSLLTDGFRKQRREYQVRIAEPASLSLTYKLKAKLSIELQEKTEFTEALLSKTEIQALLNSNETAKTVFEWLISNLGKEVSVSKSVGRSSESPKARTMTWTVGAPKLKDGVLAWRLPTSDTIYLPSETCCKASKDEETLKYSEGYQNAHNQDGEVVAWTNALEESRVDEWKNFIFKI